MDTVRNEDHSAVAAALLRAMASPMPMAMTFVPEPDTEARKRRQSLMPHMATTENDEPDQNWRTVAKKTMPQRGLASNIHTKRSIRPTDSLAYIIHALDRSDANGSGSPKDGPCSSTVEASYRNLQPVHIKTMSAYRSTPRMGVRNLSYAAPFVSPPKTDNVSLEIQPNVDSSCGTSIKTNSTIEECLTMATRPKVPERKSRVPSVRWSDTPSVVNSYKALPLHTPGADMTVKFPSEMLSGREHILRRFPHFGNSYLGMGDEHEHGHANSMPLVDRWQQQPDYFPMASPLQISDTALWEDNNSAIQRQIAVPLQNRPTPVMKLERSVNDMDEQKRHVMLERTAPLIMTRIRFQSPSVAQILALHYNKEGKCSEKVRLKLALSEGAVMPPRSNSSGYGDTFRSRDEALLRRRSLDDKISTIRIALQTRRIQRTGCHFFLYNLMVWYKRKQYQPDSNPLFAYHIRKIEGQFGSGVTSLFIFTRWLLLLNLFLCILWSALVILPQALHYDYGQISDVFYMRNLVDGQNAMAQTWLFFGNYVGRVANYPLALFYVVAILFTFFGSFLIVLRSTAQALQHGGGIYSSEFKFSSLILTSWDYSLKSHDAAVNLTTGIIKTLKEATRNEGFVDRVEVPHKQKDPLLVFLARMTAWFITIVLIGGAVVAIFKLVIADLSPLVVALGQEPTEDNVIVIYTPIVCFMFINFIVPHCIYQLPRMEHYSDIGEELRVNVCRVFVLRMANLAALIFSFHRKIQAGDFKGCAGTLVGQELYKLLLLDTISQVVLMLVWRFGRFYWQGTKNECDITALVLIIIYCQALVWLGAIVLPLMPLLGVIAMATIFLGNYVMVCYTCRPLEHSWNQPRHNTFFMTLTTVTLAVLICLGAIVSPRLFELAYVGNEKDVYCGPFGNKTMAGVLQSYINMLHIMDVPFVGAILNTLVSGAFVMPAIFILLAVVYFMYTRIHWEQRQRRIAQAELKEERQLKSELARRRHTTDSYDITK